MALPELKEFCRPQSAAELSGVFKTYEDGALFVAGGTFVHGLEARGLLSGVQALVDLRRMGLDTLSADDRGWRVGATVKRVELWLREHAGHRCAGIRCAA